MFGFSNKIAAMAERSVILKRGKDKPVRNHHPWIFSGAIDRVDDTLKAGDVAQVFSAGNEFLGSGYFNPSSQITVRLLRFDDGAIDADFFDERICRAVDLRHLWFPDPKMTNACRVIHSEGDFLPGLIVDRYADYLTVQFLTAGMDRWRDAILNALVNRLSPRGIFEKGDAGERELEGLPLRNQMLHGEEVPKKLEILENGLRFLADLREGQKTGFFLDQRDNRKLIGSLCAGKKVLNCFSYTGAFSVYAAAGGAKQVISVDSSKPALEMASEHFRLNKLETPHEIVCADVFEYLRKCEREFDFIILDPPAFCKNKHQVGNASRGYKDVNWQAIKRLSPGGLLYTASCSSFISADLFQKIVFAAAKDAGRDVKILAKTSHPADHPINVYHPEGEYLKGLLCQVS